MELLAKDEWVAPSSVVLQDDGQNEDDIEMEEKKENIVWNKITFLNYYYFNDSCLY